MKKFLLIYITGGFLLLGSCVTHHQISFSQEQLFQNEQFVKHINRMDFYVHDNSNNVIKLRNLIVQDSVFIGEVEKKITNEGEIEKIQNPKGKEIKNHKYDVNIYLKSGMDHSVASLSANNFPPDPQKIIIEPNNIEKIQGYTLDKKTTVSNTALLILLLIAGSLLLLGMILLFINLSVKASEESSGNSNSGDSGSGASSGASAEGSGASSGASATGSAASNSGSSQSNSDSGGSDSGSGDSSGGCYIATMVYGSYEAPEVLKLRKFRDKTLSNSFYGRSFIRIYYRYSPVFVERFKNSKTVNILAKWMIGQCIKFLRL